MNPHVKSVRALEDYELEVSLRGRDLAGFTNLGGETDFKA